MTEMEILKNKEASILEDLQKIREDITKLKKREENEIILSKAARLLTAGHPLGHYSKATGCWHIIKSSDD